ncbi:MAG TPA: hypothetical protein VKA85_02665 [Candidatus Limnocylindrales bacterium]|nr:hypothetical protein [Candidatus Limnocylindrales bacterium]
MPLALLLVVVATAGGTIATYAYEDEAPLVTRLAFGAATGLAAAGLVGFAATNLLGLTPGTAAAVLVLALPMAAFARRDVRARASVAAARARSQSATAVLQRDVTAAGPFLYALGAIALVVVAFDRVLFSQGGGLFTGYVNNLGDLPFHMQVTASFAYARNFPPEDPTYAGTGFAYPYISDFVAAMLVNAGATLRQAFLIQNVTLGLALVALVHRFTAVLTRDTLAAFLAPVIVLFSGGLGWVVLLDDARTTERGVFGVLSALTHDYTITGDGPYRWGNAITTLLVTQRSLLAGLPVALVVFMLLWKLVHADLPRGDGSGARAPRASVLELVRAQRIPIAAAILTGFLPLIHAHSFVVVMGTAFVLGLLFRQWRERRWVAWSVYVVIALVLALPQIWWSTRDSVANAGTFFGLEFGWDHGATNVISFWLLNTGLFIPLAALGAAWAFRSRETSRSLVLFSAAFAIWFVVPNVLKLAPWVWDNIKVLFYWFIGFVPLVALAVATLIRRRSWLRVAGVAAFVALILAGAIDVWRVVSRQSAYQEFDRDGVAVAGLIRRETPARALVLHAPTYNPPVFLTGRRSLLGYTGYIWAHGLEYAGREEDIKRIYAGAPNAGDLLTQYSIDYVLVSPLERAYMSVNDSYLAQFEEVGAFGDYRLLRVAAG